MDEEGGKHMYLTEKNWVEFLPTRPEKTVNVSFSGFQSRIYVNLTVSRAVSYAFPLVVSFTGF